MSLLWEAFQEIQLNSHRNQSSDLQEQVFQLQAELDAVEKLLAEVIPVIEQLSGQSI